MYVFAFASGRNKVSLIDSIILFIKRNFISVFLPAGGISSLAFFTGAIESKEIKKTQIHFASSIYGFIGILSVVIVAIPAFILCTCQRNNRIRRMVCFRCSNTFNHCLVPDIIVL